MEQVITLAHGAGGKQTSDLIGGIFKKYFDNEYLTSDVANRQDGNVNRRIYRISGRVPRRKHR